MYKRQLLLCNISAGWCD
ncbi:hypothetical protein [Escherichia coli]